MVLLVTDGKWIRQNSFDEQITSIHTLNKDRTLLTVYLKCCQSLQPQVCHSNKLLSLHHWGVHCSVVSGTDGCSRDVDRVRNLCGHYYCNSNQTDAESNSPRVEVSLGKTLKLQATAEKCWMRSHCKTLWGTMTVLENTIEVHLPSMWK